MRPYARDGFGPPADAQALPVLLATLRLRLRNPLSEYAAVAPGIQVLIFGRPQPPTGPTGVPPGTHYSLKAPVLLHTQGSPNVAKTVHQSNDCIPIREISLSRLMRGMSSSIKK